MTSETTNTGTNSPAGALRISPRQIESCPARYEEERHEKTEDDRIELLAHAFAILSLGGPSDEEPRSERPKRTLETELVGQHDKARERKLRGVLTGYRVSSGLSLRPATSRRFPDTEE